MEKNMKKNLSASLVAQTVKRLPAMRETQVRSLGREDPLEILPLLSSYISLRGNISAQK